MERRILLTVMAGMFMLHLNGNTIYVKQAGAGSGANWEDATGDLAAALFTAESGDEIWVAKGTYYPTNNPKDRKTAFNIPSGVKVYGGFTGNETSLQQRDAKSNKTVLSGNIGSRTDHADNSYTVVLIKNGSASTLLDGFIVADGTADGTGPSADMERCGAGMYIDGAGKSNECSPVIQHCFFQNNYARDGGAVYINGRGGKCNPSFVDCEFHSNKVDLDGGAIFNDGRHGGMASPLFQNCVFNGNVGNYGGALCNYGGKGTSSPVIKGCVFRSNEAFLRGGAIFNMDVEGEARPVINDCQFVDNQAVAGEGMYTFSKPQNEDNTEKVKYKMN